MRSIRSAFGLALGFVALLCAPGMAATSPGAAPALERGKAAECAFDVYGAYGEYRKAAAIDSTSFELWWRLAHAAGDAGDRAQFDHDRKRAEGAFGEAVRAARRAVALEPNAYEGHIELASSLGRFALFQGGKAKIRMAKEVKLEADKARAMNPRSDRAYHVLARWNRAIAELSFFEKAAAKVIFGGVPEGASMNNAVTLFEKAIALNPDHANHRLELGRTDLDLGLKDKAREQLTRALECPRQSPFDPEYKADAQVLLRRTH